MATTVPGAERDRQQAPAPDPDRIGILFVHGMGEHERGDTLKQFGEPLYTWIDRWLAGDKLHRRGRLRRLSDSSLYLPHAHDLTAPAHALVELDGPWGEHGRRRTVHALAAEAWWAKEIKSPSFSQVASWGLGLAPWMIVRYFRGGLKGWQGFGGRPERPAMNLIPLQQLLALPIVVLFQLLLLTLTVIGVVPMLRPFIASVQQKLTVSLGDPQIMVSSPFQFNAMTERVLQELAWLRAQRCAKIAVIAHSQGTGVAHAALRRDSRRVGLFVTFGTAIEKLHVARQIQRSERRLATGTLLTTLGVCSLLIGAITLFKTWPLGGYELDNGYVITGQPGDPYLLGRWLLAGGVFLILARQALWVEWAQQRRHRTGRWLTIAGGVLVVVGLELVLRAGGAVKLAWPEWNRDALRDWLTTWPPTPGALWLSAGCFVAGLGLAALREWKNPRQDDPGAMRPSQLQALPGRRNRLSWWEWIRGTWVGNVLAVVLLLAGWFPLALVNLSRSDSDDAILFLILTGLALCLAAVSVPVVDASEIDAKQLAIPRAAGDGTLVWRDYWAAADPVPDDKLTEPGGDVDFCSRRVQNRDSVIGDHTNYEENVEQFVGPVVLHLARMAQVFPGGVPVGADEVPATWQVVARAAERRPKRVTALSRGWLICVLGVPLTWLVLGTAGLTYLGIPVRDLLDAAMAILPEVGSESLGSWLPLPLLGALLVAAIAMVWYRVVVAPAWHYWDQTEADFMFRRESARTTPPGIRFERYLVGWVFGFAAFIALVAALGAPWLVKRLQDPLNVLPFRGEDGAPTTLPPHVWDAIDGSWIKLLLLGLIAVELLVTVLMGRAIVGALRLPAPPPDGEVATVEPVLA